MTDVQALHREAMELAEEAALEQATGDASRAKELYVAAFEKERQAADHFGASSNLEPTRSVLFRSAASLALDCNDHSSAEKLIARALAGNPPPEIADELRDLLEQVYFQRHLDARGVVLEPHEFQMSIQGDAVGYGVADSEIFIGRVQDLERLVYRTAERKAGRPFRERGRRDKALGKEMSVYLSAPRAGSFAVTFRLGHSMQMTLPGMDPVQSVIEEMLECIEVLANGTPKEIEQRIPDEAYRRNFLALARRIAPDGHAVRSIGFTAGRLPNGERRVLLTRAVHEIPPPELAEKQIEAGKQVTVQGTLKYADSTKQLNEIQLVEADGRKHRIIVPEGMMEDIVRPLWEFDVEVVGVRHKNYVLLKEVNPRKPDQV